MDKISPSTNKHEISTITTKKCLTVSTIPPISLWCSYPIPRCGVSLTSFMTGVSGVWWSRTECVGKLVPLPESRSFLYTLSILMTLTATAKVPKAGQAGSIAQIQLTRRFCGLFGESRGASFCIWGKECEDERFTRYQENLQDEFLHVSSFLLTLEDQMN